MNFKILNSDKNRKILLSSIFLNKNIQFPSHFDIKLKSNFNENLNQLNCKSIRNRFEIYSHKFNDITRKV